MISEQQLSELINHSGRLRMLSHRTGMMMTFISTHPKGCEDFSDELPITIDKFQLSFNKVTTSIHGELFLKTTLTEFVATEKETAANIESTIQMYQQQCSQLHKQLQAKGTIDENELHQFLTFIASDLLLALNTLVKFFEYTLSKIADHKIKGINELAREITNSLDEVDQINLSTKILSFNANVEAARAGELGKGFAVVSKEMTQLSSQTKAVSERVKKSVNAFVDALEN